MELTWNPFGFDGINIGIQILDWTRFLEASWLDLAKKRQEQERARTARSGLQFRFGG